MALTEVIKTTRALLCLECGKCTGICPVSRFNRGYSPRILLNKALRGVNSDLLKDKNIWNCLTCQLCDETCPAGIKYIELTQAIRFEATKLGEEALCSHGGAAQSLMRIMSSPNLTPRRMDWVDKDLKISDTGDTLYFVGCAPFFDVLFNDIGVMPTTGANASIKILNNIGIIPVLLKDERCCGHDLLWQGDFENFKKLAQLNINLIKNSGIKKIIFTCPECYRTFKIDYPKYFDFNMEIYHISEIIIRAIDEKRIRLKESERVITFQDPCRLGRHLGIYDEPRKVLNSIPGFVLREMRHNRNRAICCGVSAWMNCSNYSKRLQIVRLKEAKETGADLLVTACTKCEIHFNCAMKETPEAQRREEIKVETKSLVNLVAELMEE
ncbi:MAG: (Fe-S)-binding protein [candidate division WOR-3 bacterium]|nr:(Fe-S)-binding protein [candidate division WOR-3 bacterium]